MEVLSAIITYQAACRNVSIVEDEIDVTRTSTYYNEFSNEADRQTDLAKLQVTLSESIKERIADGEALAAAMARQKADDEMRIGYLKLQKAG